LDLSSWRFCFRLHNQLRESKSTNYDISNFITYEQPERAADAYKKLDRPFEVCRCYEQLGWYDQAIDILCENDEFERAIEILGRYEELKKQCEKVSNQRFILFVSYINKNVANLKQLFFLYENGEIC